MTKEEMVAVLAKYRRPGSPLYERHFQRLPVEIVDEANVPGLLGVLKDASLPARVREHAAGALGEIGDERAEGALIEALDEALIRRGAAVALGRMKARGAAEALRALAPRVKAARWALSQLEVAGAVGDCIADLQDGHLRLIGPKIESLDPGQAQAVAEELCRQLDGLLAQGSLGPEDRWLLTALQFLAPPRAGGLLTDALEQCARDEDCCDCVRTRLMRALGAIRPPQGIPALVEVICRVPNPIQKQMAVACAEKIIGADPQAALSLLAAQAGRLRRALARLRNEVATTKSVRPDRPWRQPPGSPGWFAAGERAVAAMRRLLGRVERSEAG
jgi:hypothetical protein